MVKSTASSGGGLLEIFSLLPSSFFEGIFAFALVLMLAYPLFNRLQRLLEELPKEIENAESATEPKLEASDSESLENIVMSSYPNATITEDTLSLNSFQLDNTLASQSYTIRKKENESNQRYKRTNNKMPRSRIPFNDIEKETSLEKVFDYVDDDLPLSDITEATGFDYRAYRHKLMEEVLKKYYDEKQPPGMVVMNSIHLNALQDIDSDVQELDFFGFADEFYDPIEAAKRKEAQYVHPLDHFLVKGNSKQPTEEKCIETKTPSDGSIHDALTSEPVILKNEGDVVHTPPRSPSVRTQLKVGSPRSEFHSRCDKTGEERAKISSSSKLPKTARSKCHFYKVPDSPSQPPEILRIDVEDSSTRSSDVASSLCELNDTSRKITPKRESSTKRPWMSSPKAESCNRKFGKITREDLFQARWRARPRHPSPPSGQSDDQTIVQNSMTSFDSHKPNDLSQPPSVSRLKTAPSCLQKKSEVIEKVTMLSSSVDQTTKDLERIPSRRTSRHDSFLKLREDSGCSLKRQNLRDQQERIEPPSSTKVPAIDYPNISCPNTPRLKGSRLPVHVNSKKPLFKASEENMKELPEPMTTNRSKSEDKYLPLENSSSEYISSVVTKVRRPRTSGSFNRAQSISRSRSKSRSRESKEISTKAGKVVAKGIRARISSDTITKSSSSAFKNDQIVLKNSNSDDTSKRPVSWCVNSSVKNNKKKLVEREKRSLSTGLKSSVKEDKGLKHNSEQRIENVQRPRTVSPSQNKHNCANQKVTGHGLKTYIEKLKIVLSKNPGQTPSFTATQLASLTMSESVIGDLGGANLSDSEMRELKDLLKSAEKRISLGGNSNVLTKSKY